MARQARQSRPQLVCVLADNSGSMAGEKATAATMGIREMILRCQATGPRGVDRSYFKLVLIQFGHTAAIDERCNLTPIRKIDSATIEVRGDGGGTNITEALELAYSGLHAYMQQLASHPERSDHPLPLVLLFSDGKNGYGHPEPMAEKIKQLKLDGEGVILACAGVSIGGSSDQPDEVLLRKIASQDCYVHIDNVEMLGAFLAEVGSSGASSPREISQIIRRLEDMRGITD